jgi:hypothetical protein
LETIQTIVVMERGFKMSLTSMPIKAIQRIMGVLVSMFPSITSRILVINMPGFLAWLVKFVKGFLCEASQQKLALIDELGELLEFYDRDGLPSCLRERMETQRGPQSHESVGGGGRRGSGSAAG